MLLLIGGVTTVVYRRDMELPPSKGDDTVANLGFNIWQGCILIAMWAVVLVAVVLMRNSVRSPTAMPKLRIRRIGSGGR